MKQTVSHSKLRPWQGILIVLLLVVLLVAINYLLGLYLQRLVGYTAASIAFWIIGAGIAYYTFRRFVVACTYELSEAALRLNRTYGKRERHICDIYVTRMCSSARARKPENAMAKRASCAPCAAAMICP